MKPAMPAQVQSILMAVYFGGSISLVQFLVNMHAERKVYPQRAIHDSMRKDG